MGSDASFDPLAFLDGPLASFPEVLSIAEFERIRQQQKVIMIASESIAPKAVREALAGELSNIYAEGLPSERMLKAEGGLFWDFDYQMAYHRRYYDRRYYKGCEGADFAESLAIREAQRAFATPDIPPEEIFANVQPHSGAMANNAVYMALCEPGDTVLSMDLSSGGHLTHGHPQNRSGRLFRIVNYTTDPRTGLLNYGRLRRLAKEHKPKLIIAGYSAYPWSLDWQRLAGIAHEVGAYLLADVAHTAGLIAAGVHPSPVGFADAITFTTHKTLCGPRGAAILSTDPEIAKRIDAGVFPGEQGGPHLHSILAKAVCFKIAQTPEFKSLQRLIVKNAAVLAGEFKKRGHTIAYGGTDSHMVLVNLSQFKGPEGYPLTGEIASRILDSIGIVCNKNALAGDTNVAHPSGIRLGTTWVSQLGFGPQEMRKLASVISRALKGIVPFAYPEAGDEIGRGKIDHDLLLDLTAEIREFLDAPLEDYYLPSPLEPTYAKEHIALKPTSTGIRLPLAFSSTQDEKVALQKRTVIVDESDRAALLVRGQKDRVEAFLGQVTTNDTADLEAGQCLLTYICGKDGEIVDLVCAVRLEPTYEGEARFHLICSPGKAQEVELWLKNLSDGYVLFDSQDHFAKIEGPCIIERKDKTVLTALGPKALVTLMATFPAASGIESGKAATLDTKDGPLVIGFTEAQKRPFGFLLCPRKAAKGVWNRLAQTLKRQGGTMGGTLIRDKWLDDHPAFALVNQKRIKVEAAYRAAPELVNPHKVYFIGQKRLARYARKLEPPERFAHKERDEKPKRTCLFDEHKKLIPQTYFAPFAGWLMPIRYTSTIEEHKAVRDACGIFDVSHMGTIEVSGPHATRFLDALATNYVPWLDVGESHYSYVLDTKGKVLDDIYVYRLGPNRYLVVVNAANFDKMFSYFTLAAKGDILLDEDAPYRKLPTDVQILDLRAEGAKSRQLVDIALQGPKAVNVMERMLRPAEFKKVWLLERNRFCWVKYRKMKLMVSRTGYTGEERGLEIFVHPRYAPDVWNAILKAGEPLGVKPCGLGARDSLRIEAGLPLYGHELAGPLKLNPAEAGYAGFVKLHKPFFVGKSAFVEKFKSQSRKAIRFRVTEPRKKPVRSRDIVQLPGGQKIGEVTSSVPMPWGQVGLAVTKKGRLKEGDAIIILAGSSAGRKPVEVEAKVVSRFFERSEWEALKSSTDE